MSEEINIVPDIGLAKALFSSNSTNNYSAANTGSRSVNGVTSMRYATVQEDTTGDGKVKVILDGSTEVIEVDSAETFFKGDRVCVLYMGGSYKAFSLMGDTIGGNMVIFDGIFADKIIANEAFIKKLTADEAFINNLTANKAFIGELITNNAFIDQLISNKAFIEDLEANYVTIGKTNIDQAWINDLFVKSKFVAQDGTLFHLTGLHINANDITTGILTVDRLVVQGKDGEYYLLEPDGTGKFDQTKLEGSVIKQNSIQANRILANSITTEQITTNNLVGTGGWINLAQGTFAYGNPKSVNGKLGNFITWDGTKLKLNVDDLSVDSTSFNDTLETLRTSIKQTSDKIELSATKADNAVNTANSADTKINNLLTTNFIFDVTGLSIKSSGSDYYAKIGNNGFYIMHNNTELASLTSKYSKFYSGTTSTSGYYGILTTNSGLDSAHESIVAGKVLYGNESGTQGNITISSDCLQYRFIEIIYGDDHGRCGSRRVHIKKYIPRDVCLDRIIRSSTTNSMYIGTAVYTINSSGLTKNTNYSGQGILNSDMTSWNDDFCQIRVYYVIGWR